MNILKICNELQKRDVQDSLYGKDSTLIVLQPSYNPATKSHYFACHVIGKVGNNMHYISSFGHSREEALSKLGTRIGETKREALLEDFFS
jgi:hypothetical protein